MFDIPALRSILELILAVAAVGGLLAAGYRYLLRRDPRAAHQATQIEWVGDYDRQEFEELLMGDLSDKLSPPAVREIVRCLHEEAAASGGPGQAQPALAQALETAHDFLPRLEPPYQPVIPEYVGITGLRLATEVVLKNEGLSEVRARIVEAEAPLVVRGLRLAPEWKPTCKVETLDKAAPSAIEPRKSAVTRCVVSITLPFSTAAARPLHFSYQYAFSHLRAKQSFYRYLRDRGTFTIPVMVELLDGRRPTVRLRLNLKAALAQSLPDSKHYRDVPVDSLERSWKVLFVPLMACATRYSQRQLEARK